MTIDEQIIELEKNREAVDKRLQKESGFWFMYGLVASILEIDRQIKRLQEKKDEDADTPFKGKTLQEHLSGESHCYCHTDLVCALHPPYEV